MYSDIPRLILMPSPPLSFISRRETLPFQLAIALDENNSKRNAV